MPNCDFYALREDAVVVLRFILEDAECRAYELASRPGYSVREFARVDEVLEAFPELGTGIRQVTLQLYRSSLGGRIGTRRIDFDPSKVKGPLWRCDTVGWGAIQLYLGGLHNGRILHSHTNHNSEARAKRWEGVGDGTLGDLRDWNWKEVTRISRSINRRISTLAPGRHGSRPILPAAWDALQSGGVACA